MISTSFSFWKTNFEIFSCREDQRRLDVCIEENLKITRPRMGYFSKLHVHDAQFPKHGMEIFPYILFSACVQLLVKLFVILFLLSLLRVENKTANITSHPFLTLYFTPDSFFCSAVPARLQSGSSKSVERTARWLLSERWLSWIWAASIQLFWQLILY